jgi:hypothetical protein
MENDGRPSDTCVDIVARRLEAKNRYTVGPFITNTYFIGLFRRLTGRLPYQPYTSFLIAYLFVVVDNS